MDSRFNLKVEFRIYGKEYKWDCSLNWSPYCEGELDHRITEWFLECHDEAYAEWESRHAARQSERMAEQNRLNELAELKRLQEKYPNEKI